MKRRFTILTAALALLTFLAVPMGMWGQTRTETIIWSEDFSSYSANDVPTGGTYSYACTNGTGGGTTKIYNENTGGGTAPELLVAKNNGTFTAVIPLDSFEGTLTLTYYQNKQALSVSSTTSGVSGGQTIKPSEVGQQTTTFTGITTSMTSITIVFQATTGSNVRLDNIVLSGTQVTPSTYTITAQSNNTAYGTVSLTGTTITATPNSGYRVIAGDAGYTVTVGTATVVNNGDNTFTVTPSSDCTVQINFEAIPTHTATFSVNGTTSTQNFAEGAAITFPSDPTDIEDKTFVGWITTAIEGTTNTAPAFVNTATATMGNDDVTFYAVFATATASGDPVETLTQTLQYDTWTYSGSTTDKDTYRLFHSGGYVESAVFDLSKLSKVIVYGGTFGGSSYNSLTIGDGTNTWKNVTVSGSSQTGQNTFTDGAALTGTNKLRITSNSGTASSTGVRMSKIEIFTNEPTIAYSDYCTTVEVNTDPSITVTPATIDAPYEGADGTLTLTYENITEFYSFDYYFCDAEGNELEDPDPDPSDWIYAAINEGNDTYSLDYIIDPNNGEARTAYMKIYTYDDEEEEVFAIVTVSQAAAPPKYTLTVSGLSHVALYVFAGGNDPIIDNGGEGSAQVYEGLEVLISVDVESEYILESLVVDNVDVTDDINSEDHSYTFTMPSHAVTVTATAVEYVPTGTICFSSHEDVCTKINNANITGEDDLGNTWTITTVGTTSFTPNGDFCQVGSSSNPATSITFTTTLPDEVLITGFSAMFGGYSNTAGTITLKVDDVTVGTDNLNGTNDVTVSNSTTATGTVLTVTVTDIARGVKCYFISYTYESVPTPASYPLHIDAHTADGGWCLIASPVTVDPADAGMITDDYSGDALTPTSSTYELYAFDNNQESEWRNYRKQPFNLVPGNGYLYASKAGGDFTLTGTPYSGDGEIQLSGSSTNTGNLANWNLIGNPYGVEAVISCDYFAMNSDGTGVEPKTDEDNVAAMQGVFVEYDATANPFVMFEPVSGNSPEQGGNKFFLNVSQNRGNVIDRAIVRMGEGRQLPKFQLFENSTKIYIPQNGKDYAIVSTEAQGEMPVNFRASENGTYTLSIDAEDMEMNYLHLIDNMTGMDIDLLQTPSYTFEATTRDYESRFRLVFAANNEDGVSTGSTTFAFYSNGSWIINNAGEATLQVVDLTGRILSSESVNGSVSTTLNATPGVYMLRLINGENVKVQKIVVR
jgi:hypothetical protein